MPVVGGVMWRKHHQALDLASLVFNGLRKGGFNFEG